MARTVGGEASKGVEPVAEGQSSVKVATLVEAGADAGRGPGSLPALLAVVAGALDAAPVLVQTLDI